MLENGPSVPEAPTNVPLTHSRAHTPLPNNSASPGNYVIPTRPWREGSYETPGTIKGACGSGAPVYGVGSFELS